MKQKLFLVALLVLAVAWPFMVSRGTVDIATLTMIYIILDAGLNVVVGLSGLLVLGYGGFTPSALTLCAAQSLLRSGLLDLSADCRVDGGGGGLPARFSGAASAR